MKHLLLLALIAPTFLVGTRAHACEKHLNGHHSTSNSHSDSNLESRRR